MKTSVSVFWRAVAVQLLFALLAMLALRNTALMSDPQLVQIKVTVLYVSLALVLSASQFIVKRSPLFLVFGNRLGMSAQFWQLLTYALALFYMALAVANILLAQAVTFETWAMVKTLAPLPALATFTLAVTPWLKKQPGLTPPSSGQPSAAAHVER